MTLTLTLVVLALLIGYALGKTASPSLYNLEQHLKDIKASLEKLSIALCGDKGHEKAIEGMLTDGVELSAEDLAYDGGSLRRIENAIRSGFAAK